jgi:uncharacterized protein YjbJ (UPF0337 family)
MGDRIDEMKGSIKQGVGKATGDKELETEGQAEHDVAHATRKAKGLGNQIKGSVEEGVGKLTGDDETRARGLADRVKGDAQRTG